MWKSHTVGAKRMRGTILVVSWCVMIGVIVFVVGHRLFIGATPNWVFIPVVIGGVTIIMLSFGGSSNSDD